MSKRAIGVLALLGLVGMVVGGCGQVNEEIAKQGDALQNLKLTYIIISPNTAYVKVGESVKFATIGYSAQSASKINISPSWEVASDIGSIDSTGLFTAIKIGSGEVIARLDNAMGKALVYVVSNDKSLLEPINNQPEIKISIPQGLNGYSINNSRVQLQWFVNKEPNLVGYKIFRSASENGEYVMIATTTEASYDDSTVQSNTEYYYKVVAISASGKESSFSSAYKVVLESKSSQPLPPSGITAKYGDSTVQLSWEADSDNECIGYNIYRRTIDDTSYIKINTLSVSGNSFTDANVINGSRYSYVITELNSSNKESPYSKEVSGVPLPPGAQNKSPEILINLSDSIFSPNGDGEKDTIKIEYEITDDFSSKGYNFSAYICSINENRKSIKDESLIALPQKGSFVWDGIFDNGEKIKGNDKCMVYITVRDSASAYASTNKNLYAELSYPNLDTVISLSTFSPNDDGKLDNVDIRTSANKKGHINILIKTPSNFDLYNQRIEVTEYEEIKMIWGRKSMELFRRNKSHGSWELAETFNPAEQIKDGEYVLTIIAYDEGGNISEKVVQSVVVDITPPIVNVSPSVSKFSPDGNGKYDMATFKSQMNEKGRMLYKLRKSDNYLLFEDGIYSEKDQLIKFNWDHNTLEIIAGEAVLKNIPYFSYGLPDGVYTFEVVAEDEVENQSPPVTVEVVVDLTPPQLLGFSASPEIFSPNADGQKDTTTISYEFSELVAASFEVTNYSGVSFINNVSQSSVSSNWSWDGRSSGNAVPDGNYRVRLSVEDEAGNNYSSSRYDKDVCVIVDTNLPTCTLCPYHYAFSPNGDEKYDSVRFDFEYNLNTGFLQPEVRGEAFLDIYNAQGEMIRNIYSGYVDGKNYSFYVNWDGSGLPDGIYRYSGYVVDEAGNKSPIASGLIRIDTTAPQIFNFDTSPNPFTPNGDGIKDTTTFSYTFSEPASVVIKIINSNEELYKQHSETVGDFVYPTASNSTSASAESSGDWTWNGKGSSEELLDGDYIYYLEAEDAVGNTTISLEKSVELDRPPSLVSYLFMKPDPFSPVNPANNCTEVKYSLGADNSVVKVYVQGDTEDADSSNDIIKLLVNNEVQSAGEHSVKWYGDYDDGYNGPKATKDQSKVGDGSWVIVIHTENPDYGKPGGAANTVRVDNVASYVAIKPVVVDLPTKTATLFYNICEYSSVEVAVRDQNDNLVAAIFASNHVKPNDYSVSWVGDQSGIKYHFKIVTIDGALNTYERNTEDFSF